MDSLEMFSGGAVASFSSKHGERCVRLSCVEVIRARECENDSAAWDVVLNTPSFQLLCTLSEVDYDTLMLAWEKVDGGNDG